MLKIKRSLKGKIVAHKMLHRRVHGWSTVNEVDLHEGWKQRLKANPIRKASITHKKATKIIPRPLPNILLALSHLHSSAAAIMSSISLPNIFAKAKQKKSTDVADTRKSSTGSAREMSSSLSFRNNNNSSTRNARSSQSYSLKDKVASASDSVLKGLNLAALRSEEISDDSGSFERSGKGDNKYVEVGVNELYRHKLRESIAIRRSSDVMPPNPFKEHTAGQTSPRHVHGDEKVDDIFISSVAKLDNGTSPARNTARARQRRRDSLRSLASIERRLVKNRIGCAKSRASTTKQGQHHRRASRRDSMRSLASIEGQLIKNKLAADPPANTDNANSIVAFRKKRASDGSNVSALGFDFPPNSQSSTGTCTSDD